MDGENHKIKLALQDMRADEISLLPAEWSKEVWALFRQALPDPDDPAVFNRLMSGASSRGLTYVDALMFVIEERANAG